MRISDWSSDVCSSDLVEGSGVASLPEPAPDFHGLARLSGIEGDHLHATAPDQQLQVTGGVRTLPGFQDDARLHQRSEEHTSELQSLMRISYAALCVKKKRRKTHIKPTPQISSRY